MADVNKSKLQLRSGLTTTTTNGDKTPSPATKLLINHGKPNFTIQRSHKTQNGNANATSPTPAASDNFHNNNNNNTNEFVVRSTMFNGVFKPSNISAVAKQTLPQNGNTISRNGNNDNEAAKVVLRRPQAVQTKMREQEEDENVPEFIRRQRRIQERLANQNILDFENRRSGYFTQVMISPTNPNRKSFVETMASPAVKPGLEMPAPAVQHENVKSEATSREPDAEELQQEQEQHQQADIENGEEVGISAPVSLNGQVEEEEVAKAIEEVNKAVEGEDDDKTELEDHNKQDSLQEMQENEYAAAVTTAFKVEEELQPKADEKEPEVKTVAEILTEESKVTCASENVPEQKTLELSQDETTNASVTVIAKKEEEFKSNGHAEETHHENGILKPQELGTGVTISHVNGVNGPSIPAPDPSGEKGVNYETKTVVSFSQELGNGDNKYPDTVKVIKDNGESAADSELKELTKLKFEIKADNQNIEVKSVLVNETT